MRTEQQVLDQLLSFARQHEAIRAVVLNGSRANPDLTRDLFTDYDVACYGPNPRQFVTNQRWLRSLGELVMMQQNNEEDHGTPAFYFLMQFRDGVRIDLSFHTHAAMAYLGEDTLSTVLLDKDEHIPPLPPASERGYYTPHPTPQEFADCVNEIFWCAGNVAKGIQRGELPYAKSMLDEIIRPCLVRLLSWYAADRNGWQLNTGKFGRWLPLHLPPVLWQAYRQTYAGAEDEENWQALFAMLRLTREVGLPLAESLGGVYPLEDDQRMTAYLQRVYTLPPGAVSID